MLRITLFGEPHLTYNGATLPRATLPRVLAILAFLIVRRDRALTREEVAAAMWPNDREPEARTKLRRHLHALRTWLPQPDAGGPWIDEGETIGWNGAERAWCDVVEFAAKAASDGQASEAVTLYRDDFLLGTELPWALAERARLRAVYDSLLAAIVAREERAGRPFEAFRYAQMRVRKYPEREDAVRPLIRLQLALGDPDGAQNEYRRFARARRRTGGPPPDAATDALVPEVAARFASEREQPIRGQERAFRVLHSVYESVRRGRGNLVFLRGMHGSGKSSFAEEFADRAEGARVFVGWTSETERVPFEPLITLIRSAIPHLGPRGQDGRLAPLARLIPELGFQLPRSDTADLERDRTQLFDALARTIAALADEQPVILLFPGLHAAGSATIAAIEFIARRIAERPVLIIATVSGETYAGALALAERRLRNDGRATNIVLDEPVGSAPARVERVAPEFREFAAALALAEKRCDPELLRRVLDWDEAAFFGVRRAAIAGGIARELTASPRAAISLSDDGLRTEIIAELAPAERARLQRRIAVVLNECDGINAARPIGMHLAEAGDPDEAAVWLVLAARAAIDRGADADAAPLLAQAASLAQEEATRFALLAEEERLQASRGDRAQHAAILDLLTGLARSPSERAFVLDRRLRFTRALGDPAEYERLIAALEEIVGENRDALLAVRVLSARGRLALDTEKFSTARALLMEAADRALEINAGVDACDVLLMLADMESSLGNVAATEDYLKRADREAEHVGDASARARIVDRTIAFLLREMRMTDAIAHAAASRPFLAALGDRETEADVLTQVARAQARIGQLVSSLEGYAEAATIFAELGNSRGEAKTLINRAVTLMRLGRFDEAQAGARHAEAIFAQIGDDRGRAICLSNSGLIAYYQHRFDEAIRQYERALEIAQSIGIEDIIANVLGNIGASESARGNHERGIDLLERGIRMATARDRVFDVVADIPDLVLAYVRIGDTRRAEMTARTMLEVVSRLTDPFDELFYVEYVAGLIDDRRGRLSSARAHYEAAERHFNERLESFADEAARVAFLDLPNSRLVRSGLNLR